VPVKPLIGTTFLFHEKHRNFPRKILPTIDFSAAKICALSAGKAGIFEVTENFCGSAGYWNAVLQFSRFPSANLGTENETTPCCLLAPSHFAESTELRVGHALKVSGDKLLDIELAGTYRKRWLTETPCDA
jgi:hypothetical protein